MKPMQFVSIALEYHNEPLHAWEHFLSRPSPLLLARVRKSAALDLTSNTLSFEPAPEKE